MTRSPVHPVRTRRGPAGPGRGARVLIALLAAVLAWLPGTPARAQVNQLPAPAQGVEIEEHLGRTLPMDLQFTNSDGKVVSVGDYFGKGANTIAPKPTIVALVYYGCPVACSAVIEKLAECLDKLDYTVGKDFNCLLFSFNPNEGTPMAAGLKARYLTGYNKPVDSQVRAGWEFHTGSAMASRELADAFGFRYRDVGNGQYAHSIGIFIVSPDGKIVRYIYGFDMPAGQVKLALLEASEGKMAKSIGDKFAGVCFLWDGKTGKYSLSVMRLVQVGGGLTLVLLAALVGGFLIHDRMRRHQAARAAGGARPGTRGAPLGSEQPSGGTGGSAGSGGVGGRSVVTFSGAQTG